jgi:hypothetical protein
MNPRSDGKTGELSLHHDLETSDQGIPSLERSKTVVPHKSNINRFQYQRPSLLISNKMNLSTEYVSTAIVPMNEAESMTKIEAGPPEYFYCPLSIEVMKEPVMTRWGHNFERSAIVEWIQRNEVCPLTRNPMTLKDLVINRSLQDQIQDWERRSSPRQANGMQAGKIFSQRAIPHYITCLDSDIMDLIWRDEVSANPRGCVRLPTNRLRDEKSPKRQRQERPPAA